ncbi:DUF72 domain-containing protein [Nocardioides carbamazepini]|jgi:uncharacterized protein YecE (DUF72 family)|uniref:DUF72 domain-containing protein n=1 Tax=Nocardioides carbamazepini TaxID=2854259 RepID=UPI00214A798D|nr:DUF72 domain-containing protein [Nocardioides carbamazepini]MCR1782251.1 DUF72 domain-containing protein [Nocardioides carbamazepini]
MGRIRVGTSGWSYASWRGDFYPKGLAQRRELAYLAERLSSVEVNGSFYALQRPSTYERWRDETPDDFVLAVKGSRFITHLKRLRDVEQGLARFFGSGVQELEHKLGPVLWQLPASLPYDAALMGDFFSSLPRWARHVVEFRHRSFCVDEAFAQMREQGIGCVVSDSPGRWPMAEVVTSDVVHVRLHGHTELYASGYAPRSLDRWAQKCRQWAERADVFVYFDNDARGRAPHDAVALSRRLGLTS